MDYAHTRTDEMLDEIESRIVGVYSEAEQSLKKKLDKHFEKFAKNDADKKKRVENGELTEAWYKRWRKREIMQGEKWQKLKNAVSQDLTNSDQIAASITNYYMPDVYALNHNYGTFEVETRSLIDSKYKLYDRKTVKKLLENDINLLPTLTVNKSRGTRWNKQNFQAQILQGILQGETIKEIAKRVATGTTKKDKIAALRNARTAITSAENAGRLDSYIRAQKLGMNIAKVWESTNDERTRDSHRKLDGEKRAVGERFSNGLMYPGDANGSPDELYNCRCSITCIVSAGNALYSSPSLTRNQELESMSYEKWLEMHNNGELDESLDVAAEIKQIHDEMIKSGKLRYTEEQIKRAGNAILKDYYSAMTNFTAECRKLQKESGESIKSDFTNSSENVKKKTR